MWWPEKPVSVLHAHLFKSSLAWVVITSSLSIHFLSDATLLFLIDYFTIFFYIICLSPPNYTFFRVGTWLAASQWHWKMFRYQFVNCMPYSIFHVSSTLTNVPLSHQSIGSSSASQWMLVLLCKKGNFKVKHVSQVRY